jgi:MYXO-CTERM domain-containing protein
MTRARNLVFLFTLALFTGGAAPNACTQALVSSCMDGVADGCAQDCAAGCDSCDCTSCDGCGCALGPIPGGFPASQRIANAAQVRLTANGIDFIEGMLGPELTSTPPKVPFAEMNLQDMAGDFGFLVPDVTICRSPGICNLEIEVRDLAFSAVDDGQLQLSASLHVFASNESGDDGGVGWPSTNGGDECTFLLDTELTDSASKVVQFGMRLDLPAETDGPRAGLDVVGVVPDSVTLSGLESEDVSGCDLDTYLDNGLVADIVEAVQIDLQDRLPELMHEIMCQPSADGCPTGSSDSDGICVIDGSDQCVQRLLGLEARTDLAGVLGSLGEGMESVVDLLFAAAGGSRSGGGGLNLDFGLGFEATAIAPCVAGAELPSLPVALPFVEALEQDTRPSGEGADVAVGVSVSAINHALAGMYASGLLCLEVTSAVDQLLSPSTLNILFISQNSLGKVLFPASPSDSSAGFVVRPSQAPWIEVGDPAADEDLVTAHVDGLALDFYVFAEERYVRVMTIDTDVTAGVRLDVADNIVTPRIATLTLANTSLSNADLVVDDHEKVASSLEDLAGAIAGGLAGAIPPIPVDSLLGDGALPLGLPVGIELAADSFAPLEQDGEAFLGIFLDLALTSPDAMLEARPETSVEVTLVQIPAEQKGFSLETFGQGESPRVEIHMSAAGPEGAAYEYSYRLGFSGWSPWSVSAYAVIEHPSLFLQQTHTVEARARIAGRPSTADRTSATATFVVDVTPPSIELAEVRGAIAVQAWDALSAPGSLELRYRDVDGEASAWAPMPDEGAQVPGTATAVEVKDANGNVGVASAALRGLPAPGASSGCGGCAVARADGGVPAGAWGALALGLLAWARGRRRRS